MIEILDKYGLSFYQDWVNCEILFATTSKPEVQTICDYLWEIHNDSNYQEGFIEKWIKDIKSILNNEENDDNVDAANTACVIVESQLTHFRKYGVNKLVEGRWTATFRNDYPDISIPTTDFRDILIEWLSFVNDFRPQK